jgi:hypothetical protein
MIRASSMPSNAIADPANGSLILRGVKVEVDSDVGHQFALDCTRFVEGLVTEAQLRKKYALDDNGWQALADHEGLQRAVGAQKERRIRSGEAAREKAAALFVEAPAVLGDIIKDNTASPRHRVDAIRELRACTGIGAEANTPANDRERFVININFGKGNVIHKEIELKPVEPKRDEEDLKTIGQPERERDKEDDYEEPERDRF